MSPAITRRLLTVKEYNRMRETGILTEDDRVELIDGEIFKMSPIGSKHAAVVGAIKDWLIVHTYEKAIVRVQDPITAGNFSEPEPDIAVVRFRDDYYKDEHPRPSELLLVIEVADTSLTYDREIKAPLYAKAGIVEYWIINLENRQVERFREPLEQDYRIRELVVPEKDLPFEPMNLTIPAELLWKLI